MLISNRKVSIPFIDFPHFIVPSETVHVSRHQDVVERFDQVEEQPDVDHLDVGGLWKVVADVDEHCCENQHRRHIQRDHGFEEELLEILIKFPTLNSKLVQFVMSSISLSSKE